ncbi:hypothetical protein [Agrobacterium tumefaciens]|uniref:hypothetical protein n=1 Tax=Agrobacterium TaxID=357 RepID=UPI001573172A|nr:hypothetical protein [Agrobacterium tumefaciens]NSX94055.1 hypothetical protein [Agrobacterium tumefaciens]
MVYKAFFPVLLALVILTILVVNIPQLVTIAAISIIGLPIALALWAAPSLLLSCIVFLIIFRFLPFRGPRRVFLSVALVPTTLALLPLILTLPLYLEAREWVSDDLNRVSLPLNSRTIAFRQAEGDRCDEFCILVLLAGSVEKVIVARTIPGQMELEPQQSANAFRFERRPVCPVAQGKFSANALVQPHPTRHTPPVRVNDVVSLKASQGLCLISEHATLSEADLVVTRQQVKSRGYSFEGKQRGYDDALSVYRLSAHARAAASASFREIYRHTEVKYRTLGYLLLPVLQGGGWVQEIGWWQIDRRLSRGERHVDREEDLSRFLTDTLGIKLTIDTSRIEEEITVNIEAAIAAGRAPTTGEWRAYTDYHNSLPLVDELSKPAFDLQLKILADPILPPPPRLGVLVHDARENERAALPVLASEMIKRALAGRTWPDSIDVTLEQSLENLSSGIAALPDKYLEPYIVEMARLSEQPEARLWMRAALTRLHVYGEAAVPAMLNLIEAGLTEGDDAISQSDNFQAYLAGVQGLCLAGGSASSALPQLREWLSSHRLSLSGRAGEILAIAMARMVAHPPEASSVTNRGKERSQSVRYLERSRSSDRDCHV